MAFKFNPFTSTQDYFRKTPVLPSYTVDFDTVDPNTPGTIFTPNNQLNTDTIYVSSVNNSLWTSDGITYQTYIGPTSSTTEWYLNGTTIDAGSNKTADISRIGGIYVTGITVNNAYTLPITTPSIGQVLGYSNVGTIDWILPVNTDYTRRHETTTSYDYLGFAPVGTSESATTWKLTRLTLDSSGTSAVMRATDSWVNRVTATYV